MKSQEVGFNDLRVKWKGGDRYEIILEHRPFGALTGSPTGVKTLPATRGELQAFFQQLSDALATPSPYKYHWIKCRNASFTIMQDLVQHLHKKLGTYLKQIDAGLMKRSNGH